MGRFCKLGLGLIAGVEDYSILGVENAVLGWMSTKKMLFNVPNLHDLGDKGIAVYLIFG